MHEGAMTGTLDHPGLWAQEAVKAVASLSNKPVAGEGFSY
jgi:hypothetical protein